MGFLDRLRDGARQDQAAARSPGSTKSSASLTKLPAQPDLDPRRPRRGPDFGRRRRGGHRSHRRGCPLQAQPWPIAPQPRRRRSSPSSSRRRRRAVANGAKPRVVLVVGVNGTGKTTTIGKLANLLKDEGQSPLICAADTFRAAAVEQLEIWANRAGVDMVRAQARRRSGRGRLRRDRRPARRASAMSCSSTRRGGCTPASI